MSTNGHTKIGSTPVIGLPALTQRTRPPETRIEEPQETLRQAIETARSTWEDLEARTLDLQKQIRREEHTVTQHRRKVQELEDQIMRWRPILAEAEARLESARQEYEGLARRVREGRDSRASGDVPRRPNDRAA
ncbi:MAG: hypothetical protein DMD81_02670 [Candidatus Rokuibacteriota bacterium]|nr:MAG: hypothetical protein DMD81_02670 [Candidatus Rokubacteria bacterium]